MPYACCRCEAVQATPLVPLVPAAAAGEQRSDVPCGVHPAASHREPPSARPTGSTEAGAALAASPSTGLAPPIGQSQLGGPQTKAHRVDAAAAFGGSAAVCIMLCDAAAQPPASGACNTSVPSWAPKQRLPDRAGRRREARERMRSVPKACKFPKKRYGDFWRKFYVKLSVTVIRKH